MDNMFDGVTDYEENKDKIATIEFVNMRDELIHTEEILFYQSKFKDVLGSLKNKLDDIPGRTIDDRSLFNNKKTFN